MTHGSSTALEPRAATPHSHLSSLLGAWERHADRVAFVRGDRSMTYGEARAEVFRLARALAAYGVGRGTGVALLASNTPATLLTPLAVQLLGGYYSAISPSGMMAERRRVLVDTGASVFAFDPATLARPRPGRCDAAGRGPLGAGRPAAR
jgi:fatty-acyl-CoA synthase